MSSKSAKASSVPVNRIAIDLARAVECVETRVVEPCEELLERLAPYRGHILAAPCPVTDRVLGGLAHTLGRTEEAVRHFEAAAVFCQGAAYRPELAWTCFDHASVLLDRDEDDDGDRAASLLDKAGSIASELGMRALENVVSSLRDRERAKLEATPAGLTARELEVLKHVASGLTNKEIAGKLFISTNTVAVHVARILEKTHSGNRTEAANYAIRRHLA